MRVGPLRLLLLLAPRALQQVPQQRARCHSLRQI